QEQCPADVVGAWGRCPIQIRDRPGGAKHPVVSTHGDSSSLERAIEACGRCRWKSHARAPQPGAGDVGVDFPWGIPKPVRRDRARFANALPRLIARRASRSEEHTSELQSRENLVCRLLLEKKKHEIMRQSA